MNQKNSLGLNNCFLDKNDPIDLFEVWMNEARKTEPNDPNAVALGTSDHNNSPSIRMVLLKDFNKEIECAAIIEENYKTLAEEVINLFEDKARQSLLSTNGLILVDNKFNMSKNTRQIFRLYAN